MHRRSRGGRWPTGVALAMATLATLTVMAPPALAGTTEGIDTAPAAAAFKGGAHVYAYPGTTTLLRKADQVKIEAALAGSDTYLSVLQTPALSRAQTKPVSDAIATATGRRGDYVLLGTGGAGTFLQVTSPLQPHLYGTQLRAAIAAHHLDPAGQALALTTALARDPLPKKPFPWTAVLVGGGLGVAFLLLMLLVWRRRRRRRRRLTGAAPDG